MKKLDFNVISFLVLALMLLFAAKADAQYWKNDKLFFNKNKNYRTWEGNIAVLVGTSFTNPMKGNSLSEDKVTEFANFELMAKYASGFKIGIGVNWLATDMPISDIYKKGYAFGVIAGYELHGLRANNWLKRTLNNSSIHFGVYGGASAITEITVDEIMSTPSAHTFSVSAKVYIPICAIGERGKRLGALAASFGATHYNYFDLRYAEMSGYNDIKHSDDVLDDSEFSKLYFHAGLVFNLRSPVKKLR